MSRIPFSPNLSRRLLPLYVAAASQGFVLWYAIEKVFMRTIGFDDQSVALATIVYMATMAVANVPFGILADRWSRRGVLMLASSFLLLSTLVCGAANGFWMYTAGISIWGMFYACYAGTYDSVIYDLLLEETGAKDNFEHYYGRVQLWDSVALIIGSLLSGVLAHYAGLRAVYFWTMPATAVSFFALWKFREPRLHKQQAKTLMHRHIATTLSAVWHNRHARLVAMSLVFVGAGARLLFEFSTLWFIALALPLVWFGPMAALSQISVGAGGMLAGRIKRRKRYMVAAAATAVVCGVLFTRHNIWLVIVGQMLFLGGLLSCEIILSRYLHDAVPSQVRVGASSVVTTMSYVLFMPIAALFGVLSKHAGIFSAAWVVVATGGVGLVGFIGLAMRAQHTPATLPAVEEYPR